MLHFIFHASLLALLILSGILMAGLVILISKDGIINVQLLLPTI